MDTSHPVTATPAPTPAPAAAPKPPHESILHHLSFLLPHLEHFAAFVIKAAPVAIAAGVHASPQATIALEATAKIVEAYEAHRAAAAAAQQAETPTEPVVAPTV